MDYNQLFEQIKAKKSFLCVGLDSDIAKIPPHLLQLEDPVFEFNKAVIDATVSSSARSSLTLSNTFILS